jgi:ribonucleoside-triphosphate reductase
MRFSAWQNISIRLPRIGYKCKTVLQLHKEIDRLMKIIMQGHIDRYTHICKLLDNGVKGCFNFLTIGMDNKPYLRREEAKFLVGILGLNELVQIMTGEQLHESENALKYGLEVMAYIYKSMNKYAKESKLTCLLEESPAEGISLRMALLDLKHYPEEAKKYVKGNIETGMVYYTNSVHLAYDSHVDIFTRISKQSKFSPMIQAGSIIHNFYGEHEPDPKALINLYFKVLNNTMAVQTADSPDMTVCTDCHTMTKGLHSDCLKCKSDNVYQQTRITGYFSKVSGWTKSKLAELADRTRVDFQMPVLPEKESEVEYLFFTKPNCDKCSKVKETLYAHEKIGSIKIIDTETYDGLALSMYYNVELLPTIMKVKGSSIISKLEQVGSFFKWIKENIE